MIGDVACTSLRHTAMFTYSHANAPLGQSERAYYLSYFINIYIYIFIYLFIIWQAPRAGKIERYCPLGIARFVPALTFRRSRSVRVHERFLSQNIFRDSKKIFCDFSVGMELENEKTETRYHFCK